MQAATIGPGEPRAVGVCVRGGNVAGEHMKPWTTIFFFRARTSGSIGRMNEADSDGAVLVVWAMLRWAETIDTWC